ncbi:thioredoxin fold domain-containing protein [Sinomicrobium soli]|uniref:thioredoxin fold domain-containing protein n=1 Tax=Sinomicrobium sp. N-1-3-6 TaxID=2219864 RepID=UPI000DCD3733|nr:thioredoxin fold domain-containing protein [Sinomicrobium sp. N-1-3-6]RAV29149.1 thioredoxin family protein [Sinomicrobium sp. N-1-3-6]
MIVIRYLFIFFCLFSAPGFAQAGSGIPWISVRELTDSLQTHPKGTLLYFHADWCAYCKKMERNAFRSPAVLARLRERGIYTAGMNVETTDTLRFGEREFYNREAETRRRPVHEFAYLLGSRENEAFSVPVLILLDENFAVIRRSFSYMTTGELLEFLE